MMFLALVLALAVAVFLLPSAAGFHAPLALQSKATSKTFVSFALPPLSSPKEETRRTRVVAGHSVAAAGHLLQFSRLALPLLRGGKVPSPAGLYIASTPLLPAVVGLLLAEAAREDRLASFTYRRLSLSLALSVLPPLAFAATRLSGVARASVLLTSLLTLVAALKSWAYGARGWSLSTSTYLKELAAGARQILAGLLPGYNSLKLNPARWPSSAAYLLSAYFLIFVTLQNLLPSPAPLAIRAWRMSRLQLLSTIAFCLKDAADRGRLAGSTFVRLNALLVVTSAPYAWVLVSGVGPISNPLWGAAFGAIAGLGAVQCLRQVLAKKLQQ
ncbi:hypothetical protein TeGR_g13690 [Tetraparma gracilis]|uniref:Uncharacterized protein n=1 Tax=Tetraparma gracilis TaxID=2962635 RepID=A0ABQ6MSA5_9STRA|nr:hypothetical protein TeGR_g13690 [Tetraparma gracilis]